MSPDLQQKIKSAWIAFWSQALLSLAVLAAAPVHAAESAEVLPQVAMDLSVDAPGEGAGPGELHGTLRIRGWHPQGGACLYLPFEDPDYGEDRGTSRRFEMISAQANRPVFLGGHMSVQPAAPAQLQTTRLRQLVELTLPPGDSELVLDFRSVVPRLPMSHDRHWFYDGFLPQLLLTCPRAGQDPEYYRSAMAVHLTGQIHIPSGWSYAGPSELGPNRTVPIDLNARGLAFALDQGEGAFQRKDFQAGGVKVSMLYHSEGFRDLEATISETLPVMVDILGPYPFPTLTIIETNELQRHALPGVIAMNKPAQAIFNKVQRSILNWQHWIFAIQLAHQWYGSAIAAPSPDDEWLISGISEFATLETLSRHPTRFNLFNAGFRLLSFDYLQISEVSAAVLRRSAPFSILTKPDLSTKDTAAVQPPLLFIKHAFALRQMKNAVGDQAFFRFLRSMTNHFQNQFISPREFYDYFAHLPSPFAPSVREDLTTYLRNWWLSDGWPDFALESSDQTELPDGRWITELTASQGGGIDFPPLLGVKDQSGHLYLARAAKKAANGPWVASVVTPEPPAGGEADPTHETFDADRFNNRLGLPEFTFFPGQADTLRDDAYTILWVPYIFRRPAEPFSIGLQAALFRYINSGVIFRVETAPGTKMTAVSLSDTFQIPTYALNGTLDLNQNYDRDRLAQVGLTRSPVFATNPALSLNVALRRRERASEPQTGHSTIGGGATLKPVGASRLCSYSLNAQYEKAPGAFAKGFNYDRTQATASGNCNITNRIAVMARLYRGVVAGDGDLPPVSLFKPTELAEAHLRLDQRGLDRVRAIETAGLDLYLPFYLPLPSDSLLLTRQMRWRLFYDVGVATDRDITYRDGGLGFLLPFGGDLSGAGSLALTHLSLLVVAYSEAAGQVSRKPSVLLDLSGDL